MATYDYLVVGAGLTGAIFAHECKKVGKSCLVIDKRDHIAGNVYTEDVKGIQVHKYGAHIFHTSSDRIWNYVKQFACFNHYVNSPIADYYGEIYNLPFNMNTFAQMWGIKTPDQARQKIEEEVREAGITDPKNLEEQALSLVGKTIFTKLIKEYTEKQWGRDCRDLPASIIKRLPVRFIYDNNYFNDCYQGIPQGGYTLMVEKILEGSEVRCGVEYRDVIAQNPDIADRVIYCGPIDEFFDYQLGKLEYRSLRFESELLEGIENWQGNAVVNYTGHDHEFTRIIEHKHFEFGKDVQGNMLPDTVVTREYPADWKPGDEPYYPMNDARNNDLYAQYVGLAKQNSQVVFAGRLGAYKYYDMAPCIEAALLLCENELG